MKKAKTKKTAMNSKKKSQKKISASGKSSGQMATAHSWQNKGEDIIQLILADHKPLKKLITILKDSEKSFLQRLEAFEEFAPLLLTHAKPEEETLYIYMKDVDDLREDGFEGDVEHMLADQMVEEIKRTDEDEDLWSARVKVLAELVEHHIEEEEDQLLPDFKKQSEAEDRLQLGRDFLQMKAKYKDMGSDDAKSENDPSSKNEKNKKQQTDAAVELSHH